MENYTLPTYYIGAITFNGPLDTKREFQTLQCKLYTFHRKTPAVKHPDTGMCTGKQQTYQDTIINSFIWKPYL